MNKKLKNKIALKPKQTQLLKYLNKSIAITEKIIVSRELELLNTILQKLFNDIQLKKIPNDDLFLLQAGYYFKKLTAIIKKNKSKEVAELVEKLNLMYPNNYLYTFLKGILIHSDYSFDTNLYNEHYENYYKISVELNQNSYFSRYLLSREYYMGGDEQESRENMIFCINLISNSSLSNYIKEIELLELAEFCEHNVSFYEMSLCYNNLIKINSQNLEYYYLNSYSQYKYGNYKESKNNRDIFLKIRNNKNYLDDGWWFTLLD